MKLNLVGPFQVNAPFGTEIAFAKGLRQLGHEVIEVDPNTDERSLCLSDTADATVVFKSCVGREEELRHLKHPIITYQPDDARFPHIRQMMMLMRGYSDLFLSFDKYGADVAKTMGYRAAEELLLTADPDLYSPSPEPIERDIDISFIGSLGDPVAHASRRKMVQITQAEADSRGWKTHWEISQDIPHVVDIYRRSKIVLNHATDVGQAFGNGYGLQCRHFEVSMVKTCLLSNMVYNKVWSPAFSNAEGLIKAITHLLETETPRWEDGGMIQMPSWLAWANTNYDWVRNCHMPAHRANELVNFIKRNT